MTVSIYLRISDAAENATWLSLALANRLPVPVRLKSFLRERGSLTRRLQEASGDALSLELRRQDWRRPRRSESLALGLAPGRLAVIREVTLLGAGVPWVAARSIMPAATLTGPYRYLRRPLPEPLGALLHRDPSITRGFIEVAHLSGLGKREASHNHLAFASLWLRRSIYYLRNRPLLVTEAFLPAPGTPWQSPIDCVESSAGVWP